MACVVISRNGKGEVWGFDSLRSARLHPIPQMWDVFATNGEELVRQYGRSEIETALLKFFEGRDKARLIDALEEWKSGRPSSVLPSDITDLLWDKIVAVSKKPPQSADEVLKIVIGDREALEGKMIVSRPEGDAPVKTRNSQGDIDMGEKRDVFRMADEGVISFGTDDKGEKYSATNTPKRGDETKNKFAIYREGMTVAEALAAGLTRSNIRRDRRAGYIAIQNPEVPAEEKAKTGKKGEKGETSADASAAAAE